MSDPLPELDAVFSGSDGHHWTVVYWRHLEALSAVSETSVVVTAPHDGDGPEALLAHSGELALRRGGVERTIQGLVRRVEDLGSTATDRYARIVLVPCLWTLSQRVDSRIFQNMTVVAIVRAVLRDAGVYQGDGELDVGAGLQRLPKREYCVQYRESDLDFVMRLLQEEGIPFAFREGPHASEALVLFDDNPTYPPCEVWGSGEAVSVVDASAHVATSEGLSWLDHRREMRPTGMTLRDYDFSRPRATLDLTPGHPQGERGPRAIYDYPARLSLHSYDEGAHAYPTHDGSRQARIRHELQAVAGVTFRGRGSVAGMAPGRAFTLRGHMDHALDQRYLLTAVEHVGQCWSDIPADVRSSDRLHEALSDVGVAPTAGGGGRPGAARYANTVTCVPASVPWRPARETRRPLVPASQTAVVVGPAGEEIYPDFHGRIKVQFHWDRVGQENEHSSCWVRVAQGWAGPGWGSVFIPRIGMEVVVTFLEGDPDRPLVVGCVYNGQNHVPYELPAEKTKSTIKSNSSPTTGGYNEIRFEDKAGAEQVYVQAERDHDTLVKHDQTLTVGRHRTKLIEGRERNTIVKDRMTTVQGNESKEVMLNQDVAVRGPSGATLQVDQHYHATADEGMVLTVGKTTVTLTPKEIVLHAEVIRVFGDKLVEIKGELVKINCPDGPKPPPKKKKPNKFLEALKAMKRRVDAVLDKLPAPLRKALKKAVTGALRSTVDALMHGRLPDFAAIGRGAMQAVAQGAMHTAVNTVNQAFGRIGALEFMQGNALLQQGLELARGQVLQGVGRGMQAVQSFMNNMEGNAAWGQLQRENPEAAQKMLRGMASPVMRETFGRVAVPAGSGRAGVQMFDTSGAAGRAGLRAGVAGMVG